MGYMRHHAIVVTSYDDKLIESAYQMACSIFEQVSPVTDPTVNHYRSFFVPPDGSKEGWDTSDEGDANRKRFIDWLNTQRWEDNSTSLKWVEVMYGDDNGDAAVISQSEDYEQIDN